MPIMDDLRAAMAEFERMHPAKDRPVKIRCGRNLWYWITDLVPDHAGNPLNGLPVALDDEIAFPNYAIEYADGWEVIIINGTKVRRKIEK